LRLPVPIFPALAMLIVGPLWVWTDQRLQSGLIPVGLSAVYTVLLSDGAYYAPCRRRERLAIRRLSRQPKS
jgi:membrane protein DedA with SNARE-associated domain